MAIPAPDDPALMTKPPTPVPRRRSEPVALTGSSRLRGGDGYPPGMDELSKRYGELLAGAYDCVDRIVLTALTPPGHRGLPDPAWLRAPGRGDRDLR